MDARHDSLRPISPSRKRFRRIVSLQRFYPRHVNNFVEASLRGVQDLGLSTRNWVGIERIGKAAGIPVPMGRLVEDNLPILTNDVEKLMTLRSKLKITNTPSVSIAGTYIVTPEFTGGDTNQFSTLVNAVVSMVTLQACSVESQISY